MNEELLLAISNLLDVKFEAQDKRLDAKFEAQGKRLDALEGRIGTLEGRMGTLEGRMDAFERRMDERFEAQEKRMDEKLGALRTELMDEIKKDRMVRENVVLPLLGEIKACYLSTFERYRESADRMEGAYEDISLLKKVVQKHSEKLQEHEEKLQKLA